ncbi:phosphopantetheine-binding protein, partial [Paenibacillus glucanolyticus]
VQGAEVPWEDYYKGMNRSKISLPTYPFEKTRHWFDHAEDLTYQTEPADLKDRLRQLWGTILGIQDLGTSKNFYDLGGNSLLAIRLIDEMKRLFHRQVDVMDLYTYPTVDLMTDFLEKGNEHVKLFDHKDDNELIKLISDVKKGNISIEDGSKLV